MGAGCDRLPAPDRRPRHPKALGGAWNTANYAVLTEGRRVLVDDPGRFHGVKVIGVDEHVWRRTRKGDKFVTVIHCRPSGTYATIRVTIHPGGRLHESCAKA